MNPLETYRSELNQLDDKIFYLIVERLRVAEKIAQYKDSQGLPLTDKNREADIFNKIRNQVENPIYASLIEEIYMKVMESSKLLRSLSRNDTFPFVHVGILGLGIEGGSIAKLLKVKNPQIKLYSYDDSHEEVEKAYREGLLDNKMSSFKEFVNTCELIIITKPIHVAEKIFEQVQNSLLVINTSKEEQGQDELFEKLTNEKVEFISTYPILDNKTIEKSISKATLFNKNPWIIIPHRKSRSIETVKNIITYLNSIPIVLTQKEHNEIREFFGYLPDFLLKTIYQ